MARRLAWADSKSENNARFVIAGVPDETGSKATRKSSSKAPAAIREISWNREAFKTHGPMHLARGLCGKPTRVWDDGNITRKALAGWTAGTIAHGKIPIVIGGDHSLTFEALRGISRTFRKPYSVVYFDAHPDLVCTSKRYYGSVLCDARVLRGLNMRKSAVVGLRAPEDEEIEAMKQYGLKGISPSEIVGKGLSAASRKLLRGTLPNVYISVDMDCVDPAFAPGVSTPVPGGLSSIELLYLLTELAKHKRLIGLDVMQVCPNYDPDGRTVHLAERALMETIACSKVK